MGIVYRLGENIVFRNTRPDLIMAFDKANGVMYELNDTATSVLKLIDGSRDIDGILTCLLDEFDAGSEELKADVESIINRFVEVSIIVPV